MGVVSGVPPTARNVAAMADNIRDGSHWGVLGIPARPAEPLPA
jgi:uncharacterized protein (DUF849 family)